MRNLPQNWRYWYPGTGDQESDKIIAAVNTALANFEGDESFVFYKWEDLINRVNAVLGLEPNNAKEPITENEAAKNEPDIDTSRGEETAGASGGSATKRALVQALGPNHVIPAGKEGIQQLIMGVAQEEFQWRSLSQEHASQLTRGMNMKAPGQTRDLAAHVGGKSAKTTAYISVSKLPSNRFRADGAAQAVVLKGGGDYITNDELTKALKGDQKLIKYAGRAGEELYVFEIPRANIYVLEEEITGIQMEKMVEVIPQVSLKQMKLEDAVKAVMTAKNRKGKGR